ncbi:MAG: LysM peptidoglycan-binding domain-containing protein, partial [Chloroflexi bacterium]|nr:LysM peptidoglycan-binding domain-containing protein [Chloroflexota bacterium]
NYRGTALLLAQRPDLAVQEYEAIKALDPDAKGWIGMGNARLALREWAAARWSYQQALTFDPYSAAAYCGMGATYTAERDISRALTAYGQAIALEPKWGVPYAMLGRAHELVAAIDAAKEAYDCAATRAAAQPGLLAAVSDRAVAVVQNPPTPVPTATPRPTSTPAPTPVLPTYTVKKDDTLASISQELGISVERIAEINNLEDIGMISVGQQLIIPEEED